MNSDLLNHLPYEARSDLRVFLLSTLLWGTPRDWRMRRTDHYCDRDGVLFDHKASIDFRIERQFLVDSLSALRWVYERTPSLLEFVDVADTLTSIDELKNAALAGCSNDRFWSTADIIVPVGWMYGRGIQLEVALDGRPISCLNRPDTAKVVSRSLAYLVARLLDDTGCDLAKSLDPALLRRYVRLVTMCDAEAVAHAVSVRRLSAARANACMPWMEGVLRAYGFEVPDRSSLEHKLQELRQGVDGLLRLHDHPPDHVAMRMPLYNPLLLFPAFMCRTSMDERQAREATATSVISNYFEEAGAYVELVGSLLETVDQGDGTDAYVARTLVSAVNELSWQWPLLARTTIGVGDGHTFSYTSTAESVKRGLRGWLRHDLFMGDAATYHVELSTAHGELELVPKSACVEVQNESSVQSLKISEVFDRTAVDSRMLQGFYTYAPWAGPAYRASEVTRAVLKVRQRVNAAVMTANWLVVLGLAGGTLYLWFLTVMDILESDHGKFTVIGVFKTMVSVYLAVLLIFTLERHGSPLVARRLRWPWVVTVGSLVLGSFAIAVHALYLDPEAIPFITQFREWGRLLIDWASQQLLF